MSGDIDAVEVVVSRPWFEGESVGPPHEITLRDLAALFASGGIEGDDDGSLVLHREGGRYTVGGRLVRHRDGQVFHNVTVPATYRVVAPDTEGSGTDA